MKTKKTILLVLIIILSPVITLTKLQAQQAIVVTGGNASGNGGSVSYSVGQLTYQAHTGQNGSVCEGVQQPYEISIVTGIKKAKGIKLALKVYPNPVKDLLILSISDYDITGLSCFLFDMNGKMLQSKKVTASEIDIHMGSLKPAVYFLKIIHDQKEIKTFKIIKN